LNDPFDEVDASSVEETVDNAIKAMVSVIRFLKIADQIKADVDLFKPWVPILTSLRTDGMKDRHWDMLT
jgi:dynein heavy chain